MKSTILYSLFLLLTSWASAQVDTTVLNTAWGGSFGVGVGHRFLTNSNSSFSEEEELYDSLETSSLAYYGEFNYYKRLNAHFRLQGGLGMMRLGYHVDSIPDAGIKEMKLNYQYGIVPVKLQWISNEKRPVAFTSCVGIVPMFLLKQNTVVTYIGDSKKSTLDTQSDKVGFGVAAHLSAGVEAYSLKKYRLCTEVFYRQSLTSSADGDMQRFLNAIGISFSIIKTL